MTGQTTVNRLSVMAALFVAGIAGSASAIELTLTIENLAPQNGTYLTPTWVAFHDGSFNIFDYGFSASAALERLAEDGDTGPISDLFDQSGRGDFEATIAGPNGPYAPGDSQRVRLQVDAMSASSRYFSFATMVIPSNDAFIGNDNALAFRIFDNNGNFLPLNMFILGSMVLDAGTEVNTEAPLDTAFFGQQQPNTGPDENGVVHIHPGYKRPGQGGILDDPRFANADFIIPGYPIAQIRITPEPTSAALLLVGGATLLRRRRAA